MCAYVVVAEDDEKQAELIRRYLEHEGHEVTVVHDGRAALERVRRSRPALLILDVMMPRVDGLDVCRVLRAESGPALPVLMLTARSTEDDLLLGLDLGADDYMTKPFSPRELMARVRSLLRRSGVAGAAGAGRPAGDGRTGEPVRTGEAIRTADAVRAGEAVRPDDGARTTDADAVRTTGPADPAPLPAEPGPVLRAGPLAIDPARHEVRVAGERTPCTPGEFRLLELLASRPGQVFTRDQILAGLHGFNGYITSRTVDVHIMNLRKKLGPVAGCLVTVYGVGYKLAEDGPRGR